MTDLVSCSACAMRACAQSARFVFVLVRWRSHRYVTLAVSTTFTSMRRTDSGHSAGQAQRPIPTAASRPPNVYSAPPAANSHNPFSPPEQTNPYAPRYAAGARIESGSPQLAPHAPYATTAASHVQQQRPAQQLSQGQPFEPFRRSTRK